MDLKVAVYRFGCSLALRRWGATEICGCTPLLEAICDPRTEGEQQGCEWRHSLVCLLCRTIDDAQGGSNLVVGEDPARQGQILQGARDKLLATKEAGPYGQRGSKGGAVPIYATERRA